MLQLWGCSMFDHDTPPHQPSPLRYPPKGSRLARYVAFFAEAEEQSRRHIPEYLASDTREREFASAVAALSDRASPGNWPPEAFRQFVMPGVIRGLLGQARGAELAERFPEVVEDWALHMQAAWHFIEAENKKPRRADPDRPKAPPNDWGRLAVIATYYRFHNAQASENANVMRAAEHLGPGVTREAVRRAVKWFEKEASTAGPLLDAKLRSVVLLGKALDRFDRANRRRP